VTRSYSLGDWAANNWVIFGFGRGGGVSLHPCSPGASIQHPAFRFRGSLLLSVSRPTPIKSFKKREIGVTAEGGKKCGGKKRGRGSFSPKRLLLKGLRAWSVGAAGWNPFALQKGKKGSRAHFFRRHFSPWVGHLGGQVCLWGQWTSGEGPEL